MNTAPLPPHFIMFCRAVRDALEAGKEKRPAWFSYHSGLCWNYRLWLDQKLEEDGMDRKRIHPELFNADNMLSAYFRQRYACGAFPFNAGKEDEYDHEVDEGIAYDNPARRAFIYEIAALDDKA